MISFEKGHALGTERVAAFLEYTAAANGLDPGATRKRIDVLLELVNLVDARKRVTCLVRVAFVAALALACGLGVAAGYALATAALLAVAWAARQRQLSR